jgi:hypothetical protein
MELSELTNKELKNILRQNDVKNYSKLNKKDLVKKVNQLIRAQNGGKSLKEEKRKIYIKELIGGQINQSVQLPKPLPPPPPPPPPRITNKTPTASAPPLTASAPPLNNNKTPTTSAPPLTASAPPLNNNKTPTASAPPLTASAPPLNNNKTPPASAPPLNNNENEKKKSVNEKCGPCSIQ